MRIIIEIAGSNEAAPTVAVTGATASEPWADAATEVAPQAALVRASRATGINAGPAPLRDLAGTRSLETDAPVSLGPAQDTDALSGGSAPAP